MDSFMNEEDFRSRCEELKIAPKILRVPRIYKAANGGSIRSKYWQEFPV